jgi:hypothetical protein
VYESILSKKSFGNQDLSDEEIKNICKETAKDLIKAERKSPTTTFRQFYSNKESEEFLWSNVPHHDSVNIDRKKDFEKNRCYKSRWADLESAKEYIHGFGLKSVSDWYAFRLTADMPNNIPGTPQRVYIDWNGWANFLGKHSSKDLLTFQDARTWVIQNLVPMGINTGVKFTNCAIRPLFLPKYPEHFYKESGWQGWDYFLGLTRRKYLPYHEAKAYVQSVLVPRGIDSFSKYLQEKSTLPDFLPVYPNLRYKGDWDVSDFFGRSLKKGWIKKEYLPFKEAREWVRLNLRIEDINTSGKWHRLIHGEYYPLVLPENIPRHPNGYYKEEWVSWYDWLGKASVELKRHLILPYQEAKIYVQKYLVPEGINTLQKYLALKKKLPSCLPKDLIRHYKNNGWVSAIDFFGRDRAFLSYKEAKRWVQHHLGPFGIDSDKKWKKYLRGEFPQAPVLPLNIPRFPYLFYLSTGEWKDYFHFFGKKKMADYETVRAYVIKYLVPKGINTLKKYKQVIDSLPANFPHSPNRQYINNGWTNGLDFFGLSERKLEVKVKMITYKEAINLYESTSIKFNVNKNSRCLLNFVDAKRFVQTYLVPSGIINLALYRDNTVARIPSFLPLYPEHYYAKRGWTNAHDFFGQKYLSGNSKIFMPYVKAQAWVASNLVPSGINSSTQWRKYVTGAFRNLPVLPNNLPKSPYHAYQNKGWKGYAHWFYGHDISKRMVKYGDHERFANPVSYEQAKQYVQTKLVPLGIDSLTKYQRNKKLIPPFLPLSPRTYYRNRGWKNCFDFFGKRVKGKSEPISQVNSKIRRRVCNAVSYEEAKKFVQENIVPLGINTLKKYRSQIDLVPDFLPANPDMFYKNSGWISSRDFFGKGEHMQLTSEISKKENSVVSILDGKKGYIQSSNKLSYESAREYVRKYLVPIGIKSIRAYRAYRDHLPKSLPLHPKKYYKNKGWVSSKHFFGGGHRVSAL